MSGNNRVPPRDRAHPAEPVLQHPAVPTTPADLERLARDLSGISHYDLLGVDPSVSREAIVTAGMSLQGVIQRLAPSSNPGHVVAVLRAVDAAVAVLTDATRRALYDRFLADRSGSRSAPRSGWVPRPPETQAHGPELSFDPTAAPRPPSYVREVLPGNLRPTPDAPVGEYRLQDKVPPRVSAVPSRSTPHEISPDPSVPRTSHPAERTSPTHATPEVRAPSAESNARTTRSMRRPSLPPTRESNRPSSRARPSSPTSDDPVATAVSAMRKDFAVLASAIEICLADLSKRDGPQVDRVVHALRGLANVRARQAVSEAEAEERLGHWAAAATWWQRAIAARPDDGRYHLSAAATILRAGGDLDAAEQLALRAVELGPDTDLARTILGEITARRSARSP